MYCGSYEGVELYFEIIDTKMGNKRKALFSTEVELGRDVTKVYLEGLREHFDLKEVG